MADIYNAIFIGFPFQQDFEAEPDAIALDAVIWLRLRRAGFPHSPTSDPVDMVRVSATVFSLRLTEEQTATMRAGSVEGDLMLRTGANSQPVGLRLVIPVEAVI